MHATEKHFRLVIEYDGTGYHGWQRQPEDKSIQETIETALATMTAGRRVILTGSGRTDAGVHALGQVAHFSCDTAITAEGFQKGLNALLPDDIAIRACTPVSPSFHARYDAIGKTYRYRIVNRPFPPAIGRCYAWHIRTPLDLAAMDRAARALVGTHDFCAFEGAGSPRASTERTIFRAEFRTGEDGLVVFEIDGSGFLRYMVRNIVGTLVEVGRGRRAAGTMARILADRDRARAGATAPPQGLFLVCVRYPEEPQPSPATGRSPGSEEC